MTLGPSCGIIFFMDLAAKNRAVHLVAAGAPQEEVAAAVGVSQSTISRLIKQPEIRKQILEETNRLLAILPDITSQLIRDIKHSDEISKVLAGEVLPEDYKGLPLAQPILVSLQTLNYKKMSDILRTLGIYPSQTPSVFIQQVFNQNQTNVILPQVLGAIGRYVESSIIDAESSTDTTQKTCPPSP